MVFDQTPANLDGGESRNSKRRNQQQQQQQRLNRSRSSSNASNNDESGHYSSNSNLTFKSQSQQPSPSGNRAVKRPSYELAQQNHPAHLVGLHQSNRGQMKLDFFDFESNQRERKQSDGMERRVGKKSSDSKSKQTFRQERGSSGTDSNAGTTDMKSNLLDDSCDSTFCQALLDRFKKCAKCTLKWFIILLVLGFIVYHWPISGAPEFDTKVAPNRVRPQWSGPLAMNEDLEQADLLFSGQFNAPESMAWSADKRSFYTGVEGGFILFVEPYEERWSIAAKVNARNSVLDETSGSGFDGEPSSLESTTIEAKDPLMVPFCSKDVEIYGKRAEFEPRLVRISRCSRPLGIRLSPNETYLYVNDGHTGFYKIELELPGKARKISKLIDFSQYHAEYNAIHSSSKVKNQAEDKQATTTDRVLFGDDIAVDWGAGEEGSDVIYMTDCSRLVPLRDLFRLMLEYDDTGRVLIFDTRRRRIRVLEGLSPVQMPATAGEEEKLDWRSMSFPNGLEMTANKSALLISDLNNRRVLMHHIRGPLAGTTKHLFWGPGHSDNIRRGLDLPDGRPTYWSACGCAVEPNFELTELARQLPRFRKFLFKFSHFLGHGVTYLGELFDSIWLKDFGFERIHCWLTRDFLCSHGVVYQFTEQGEILRSFHAPHFGSNFRLLSEAYQVPLLTPTSSSSSNNNNKNGNTSVNSVTSNTPTGTSNTKSSLLYLGSVFYPYLGRLELGPLEG